MYWQNARIWNPLFCSWAREVCTYNDIHSEEMSVRFYIIVVAMIIFGVVFRPISGGEARLKFPSMNECMYRYSLYTIPLHILCNFQNNVTLIACGSDFALIILYYSRKWFYVKYLSNFKGVRGRSKFFVESQMKR